MHSLRQYFMQPAFLHCLSARQSLVWDISASLSYDLFWEIRFTPSNIWDRSFFAFTPPKSPAWFPTLRFTVNFKVCFCAFPLTASESYAPTKHITNSTLIISDCSYNSGIFQKLPGNREGVIAGETAMCVFLVWSFIFFSVLVSRPLICSVSYLLIQPTTNAKGSLSRRDNNSSTTLEDAGIHKFYWTWQIRWQAGTHSPPLEPREQGRG